MSKKETLTLTQLDNTVTIFAEEDLKVDTVERCRKTIHDYLSEHSDYSAVVLDLSKIDFMDSCGLKLLVGLYKSCTSKNASLEIVNQSKHIGQLLKICGIDRLVSIRGAA